MRLEIIPSKPAPNSGKARWVKIYASTLHAKAFAKADVSYLVQLDCPYSVPSAKGPK
jgi:hypothetical protein